MSGSYVAFMQDHQDLPLKFGSRKSRDDLLALERTHLSFAERIWVAPWVLDLAPEKFFWSTSN